MADDLVVIQLPGFQRFKDITAHFISERELNSYILGPHGMQNTKKAYLHMISAKGETHGEKVDYVYLPMLPTKDYGNLLGFMEYAYKTEPGDCGAILTSTGNNIIASKVLSIHCYGDN